MSAYIVNRQHIDQMVRLAISGAQGSHRNYRDGLQWYTIPSLRHVSIWELDQYSRVASIETADSIGRMLWGENLKSIEYRYPDTVESGDYPGPVEFTRDDVETYTYPIFGSTRLATAVEGLALLSCYEYQSCEHPEWETSEARLFCDALKDALIRDLPGYLEAPREWCADSLARAAAQ